MLYQVSSNLRKLIFLITALVALFIFIFLRPVVSVEEYVENDGSEKPWTKETLGHKMAVAVGNSLSPDNDEKE